MKTGGDKDAMKKLIVEKQKLLLLTSSRGRIYS